MAQLSRRVLYIIKFADRAILFGRKDVITWAIGEILAY